MWNKLFLQERPSIGLAFFRIWAALTVGLHVIPSFFQLHDNYLSTAFKTYNGHFFPIWFLDLVAKSPDWLVYVFVGLFYLTWLGFLIGWHTQVSAICMLACGYYFYALNCFHIGTLSWDILLVTLFLMCVTAYPGDYFSVDALRNPSPDAFARRRPFFIQRLLQIQIALTYFFTGLYKITGAGNWVSGNPMHALMNYPVVGVTKNFLLKEFLAGHPHVCYWVGIFIFSTELSMPFLLFYRKTRRTAIVLGIIFHILLILTFDVPAIFFFLFPAQLLLFIDPKDILAWIHRSRSRSHKVKVLYDGDCGFCRASVERLKVMDLWGHLTYEAMPETLSELKVVDDGKTYGGFEGFRRMCFLLPMLYPFLLVAYLPGASIVGSWAYAFIAKHRYLFHRSKTCTDHQCFRQPS